MLRNKRIGFDFEIKTDLVSVRIERVAVSSDKVQIRTTGRDSVILVPEGMEITTAARQKFMQRVVVEALRTLAEAFLPSYTREIAVRHDLIYNRIVVKRISTRWGSCSSLRNLNFSVYLMLLPLRLIDYVVCHELAHLTHLNHSPAFWREVDRLTNGQAKQLDGELKEFGRKLSSREM